MTLSEWMQEVQRTNSEVTIVMKVKGFINQHMSECESLDCVCARVQELYDSHTDRYLNLTSLDLVYQQPEEDPNATTNNYDEEQPHYSLKLFSMKKKKRHQPALDLGGPLEELHRSDVFINHFYRQLYKDALSKFVSSVSIHILFAYYYFNVMRNVHAALHELKIAAKKRPNLYQQFTIYRYEQMIESAIKTEAEKNRDAYHQLTNVKEFERLFMEMAKQIERVCNHQVEFWTHLATVIPDLNFLSSLNNLIVDSAARAEHYWGLLCRINPNYPQALVMFSEYLSTIRNNQKEGKLYSDKADKLVLAKSGTPADSVGELLFSDEAVIVHVSGNKASSGTIVKVSHGLKKCFGWDKSEVLGQNVNLLMSNMFANKHNAFLDQYYNTARRVMFNKERQLFAAQKHGCCFQITLLIKQMPSLKEGIQYVGMIKPQTSGYDYILTDLNGYIDSFTTGIGLLFNINPLIVKDSNSLNIQFIAPELVKFFDQKDTQEYNQQHFDQSLTSSVSGFQNLKSAGNEEFYQSNKYSVPGGDTLTFYIPKNFTYIIKQDYSVRGGGRNSPSKKGNKSHNENAYYSNSFAATNNMGQNGQPLKNTQSPIFKEFVKYVYKTGKQRRRRAHGFTHVKQLLQCQEYKDYDTKKTLKVEIREWSIPLGNSVEKGIRLLLFKIPKNQHNEGNKSHNQVSFEDEAASDELTPAAAPDQFSKIHGAVTTNAGQHIYELNGGSAQKNPLKSSTTSINAKPGSVALPKPKMQKTKTMLQAKKTTMPIDKVSDNLSFSKNLLKPEPNIKKAKTNLKNMVSFNEGESNVNNQSQAVKKRQTMRQVSREGNNLAIKNQSGGTQGAYQRVMTKRSQQNVPATTGSGGKGPNQSNGIVQESSKRPPQQSFTLNSLSENMKFMATKKEIEEKLTDMDLGKIERQETDDMDEDDQSQLDTLRIDVKKDIALNDDMVNPQAPSSNEIQLNPSPIQSPILVPPDQQDPQTPSLVVQNLFVENPPHGTVTENAQSNINQSNMNQQSNIESVKRGSFYSRDNNKPIQVNQSRYQTHSENAQLIDLEERVETIGGFTSNSQKKASKSQTGRTVSEGNRVFSHAEEGEDYGYFNDAEYGEYYEDGEYDEENNNFEEDDLLVTLEDVALESGRQRGNSGMQDARSILSNNEGGRNEEELHLLLPHQSTVHSRGQHNNYSSRHYSGYTTSKRYNAFPSGVGKYRAINSDINQQLNPTEEHQMMSGYMKIQSQHQNAQAAAAIVKKHDYSRIVTNKLHVCFDEDKETCGSFYFNEWNASENELDIRETIKVSQARALIRLQTTRKLNKSKSRPPQKKKTNLVSMDQLEKQNDEGEPDEGGGVSGEGAKDQKNDDVNEQTDSFDGKAGEKGMAEIEDGNALMAQQTTQATQSSAGKKKDIYELNNDEGEVSSIASTAQSQTRTFYSLKEAIDEKFVPLQIKNLRFVANLVWLSILFLSIAYFAIQSALFRQIQSFIQVIVTSERRIEDLMTLNLKLVDIALLNQGEITQEMMLGLPLLNGTDPMTEFTAMVVKSAKSIQEAQTYLSLNTADLDESIKSEVSPREISISYFEEGQISSRVILNIWEAILKLQVTSFSLADQPDSISFQNDNLRFIQENSMNSVLEALQSSTQAVSNYSDTSRESNNQVFLILVITVSGALLLSMAFLLPVIRRAKNNKQEVFVLLTHKKVEKLIEEQIKKCRVFSSKYQQQGDAQTEYVEDPMLQDNNINHHATGAIEENVHIPGEGRGLHSSSSGLNSTSGGSSSDDKKDDYISNVKKQKKKWRPLNNNFLILSLKFLAILLLIETFFLYFFLTSSKFLTDVGQLTHELRNLLSRYPLLQFSMLLQKTIIYQQPSNNVTFLSTPVKQVALDSLQSQNRDYQTLLEQFQTDYEYHTEAYNRAFEVIMYEDACLKQSLISIPIDQMCAEMVNQDDGLYRAVVKYWSDLKGQLRDNEEGDQNSEKIMEDLKGMNQTQVEKEIVSKQLILERYINVFHQYLGEKLREDIDTAFYNEFTSLNTFFAIFLIYVVFIYLVVWRLFMKSLLEELWRAKACLALLPIEMCFRIEEIRAFIYRNSSGFVS